MTVTKETSLLCSFRLKIDEAMSCVPKMSASEKFKAVQFWNLISQKLQSIVNSNAADINDVAYEIETEDSEKIHLETESSKSVNTAPNCSISSDFMSMASHYGISNEIIEQYHLTGISNAHLLAPETLSSVSESSLNSIRSISQLNLLNNAISHHSLNLCERSVNNYMTVHNLSENGCNTFETNSSVRAESRAIETDTSEHINNDGYVSDTRAHPETHQMCESSKDTVEIPDNSYNLSDNAPLVPHNDIVTKDNEAANTENCDNFSTLKQSFLEDKLSSELHNSLSCDNQMNAMSPGDSECFKDNVKHVIKAGVNAPELLANTESSESIVSFVVSCTEEIITKNEIATELKEKCSDGHFGHKGVRLKRYNCSECPAKFATTGSLNVHIRKHTGERPYPCSKCSSSFTTKGNLMRHIKIHTGEKPYTCTHCGGKFTAKKSLNVHMRRHTGEKPYECKECGKRFAQSSILQTHMAMHLNQKIHLCEHCGKSFRQKAQLQTHKLRHENIRRHGCSLCPARFLIKGDLERHMRCHTGERPFVCEICSRSFTRQQTLNEHMNRHYGLRPYVCKYCSRTFAEMSNCYKHIKHHEKTAAGGCDNSQTESSIEEFTH